MIYVDEIGMINELWHQINSLKNASRLYFVYYKSIMVPFIF